MADLSFPFRGRRVPVTKSDGVTTNDATLSVDSDPFKTWYLNCERETKDNKSIEIHSVELQSVDLFGARRVGFIKINSECTLVDGDTHHEHRLPGICFLRGNAVTILVALFCEDGSTYSLLVDQPRIPIGQVSCLELPAGMIDDEKETIAGIAIKELEEECGIHIQPRDLTDLTELAEFPGIPPSPGGCDEFCRFMYLEKKVTVKELEHMRGRLAGLREHGEYITLRVVSFDDVWKASGDAKAMMYVCLKERRICIFSHTLY
jgi:ADP-sugar diphosphatase